MRPTMTNRRLIFEPVAAASTLTAHTLLVLEIHPPVYNPFPRFLSSEADSKTSRSHSPLLDRWSHLPGRESARTPLRSFLPGRWENSLPVSIHQIYLSFHTI